MCFLGEVNSVFDVYRLVAAETIVTPGLAFSVMVGLQTNFNEVEGGEGKSLVQPIWYVLHDVRARTTLFKGIPVFQNSGRSLLNVQLFSRSCPTKHAYIRIAVIL